MVKASKLLVLFLLLAGAAYLYAGSSAASVDYGWLAQNARVVTGIDGQQYFKVDDMLFPVPQAAPEGVFNAVTINNITLWPDGVVKYKWTSKWVPTPVSDTHKDIFRTAATEWSKGGTIAMIEDETATEYCIVPFEDSENGSPVGMDATSKSSAIGIHDWNVGTVAHEIGHALGLYHEHQRQDRDTYITINLENIVPAYTGSFSVIMPVRQAPLLTGYDFLSIMHYNDSQGSIGGRTMECKTGYERFQEFFGSFSLISPMDRYGVMALYGKNPQPMFDVSVTAEGPGACFVFTGGMDGKSVPATLLEKSFPGAPARLSVISDKGAFSGWTCAPEGSVSFTDPENPSTEAIWNSSGTAKAVFARTSVTGTIGSIFTLQVTDTLGNTGSFPIKPIITAEGKKARTISSNTSLLVFEWKDAKVPAGTHPLAILSGKTSMNPACDLVLVPPKPETATMIGTSVIVEGLYFGKTPIAAIGGRRLSAKTVFDPKTGVSKTTIKNPKGLTGAVTITNKLGTEAIDINQ